MTIELDQAPGGTLRWEEPPFRLREPALPPVYPVRASADEEAVPPPYVEEQGGAIVVDVPRGSGGASLHARSSGRVVEIARLGEGRAVVAAERLNGHQVIDVRAQGAPTRTVVRGRGVTTVRVIGGAKPELGLLRTVAHTSAMFVTRDGDVIGEQLLEAHRLVALPAPCFLVIFVEDHGGGDGRVLEVREVSATGSMLEPSAEDLVLVTQAVLAAKVPHAVGAAGRGSATLRSQERIDGIARLSTRAFRWQLRDAMAAAWTTPRGLVAALYAADFLRRAGRATEIVSPTPALLADLNARGLVSAVGSIVGDELVLRLAHVGFSPDLLADASATPTARLGELAERARGDSSALRGALRLEGAAQRARAMDGAFADVARNQRVRAAREAISNASPADVDGLIAEVASIAVDLGAATPASARVGADVDPAPHEREAHAAWRERVARSEAARVEVAAAMVQAWLAEGGAAREASDAVALTGRLRAAESYLAVEVPSTLPVDEATVAALGQLAGVIDRAAEVDVSPSLAARLRETATLLRARRAAWAVVVAGAAVVSRTVDAAHPHRRIFGAAAPRPADAARVVEAIEAGALWDRRPRDLGLSDDALSSVRVDHPEVKARVDALAARAVALEGSGVDVARVSPPALADGRFAARLEAFWAFLHELEGADRAVGAEVDRIDRAVAPVIETNAKLLTWVALARGAISDPVAEGLLERGLASLLDAKAPGAFAARKRAFDLLAANPAAVERLSWAAVQAFVHAFPRAKAELSPVLSQDRATTEIWLRVVADTAVHRAPPWWAAARAAAREHPWLPSGPAVRQRAAELRRLL